MSRSRLAVALSVVLPVALAGCNSIEDLVLKRPPGEKLYRNLCADCHGIDGRGNTITMMGETHTDLTGDMTRGSDVNSIEVVVREGVFGKMPAHDELSREQMKQLLDHIDKLRREARGPS